jgi:hypothetical protein
VRREGRGERGKRRKLTFLAYSKLFKSERSKQRIITDLQMRHKRGLEPIKKGRQRKKRKK